MQLIVKIHSVTLSTVSLHLASPREMKKKKTNKQTLQISPHDLFFTITLLSSQYTIVFGQNDDIVCLITDRVLHKIMYCITLISAISSKL